MFPAFHVLKSEMMNVFWQAQYVLCDSLLINQVFSKNQLRFKSNINPKNKLALVWPFFSLSSFYVRCIFTKKPRTVSDAKSCWQMKFSTQFPGELNQISSIWCRRIKTEGMRGLALRGSRNEQTSKNGHFSNMFNDRASPAEQHGSEAMRTRRRHLQAFLPASHLTSWGERISNNSSTTLLILSPRWLFLRPAKPFASDNLACSQLSKSHGPEPKMIYIHRFLNINHCAQPSCKTDVKH